MRIGPVVRWARLSLGALLLLTAGVALGASAGWWWYSTRPLREAQIAYDTANYSLALRWAKWYLRTHPNSQQAILFAARAAARTGAYQEAISRYEILPEYSAEDQYLLGYSHAQLGNLETAAGLLETAVLSYDPPEARRSLIVVLQQLGKTPQALEQARELSKDPKEGDLGLAMMGEILFFADQPRESHDAFAKLLENNPDLKGIPFSKHHVLLCQVESLLKLGETEKATHVAEQLGTFGVDAEVLDARSHRVRGLLYFQQGKRDKAREDWLNAVQMDPADAQVRMHLGELALKENQLDEAADWFEQAVQRAPRHVAAHQQLAMVYGRQGKSDLALEHRQLARTYREKITLESQK